MNGAGRWWLGVGTFSLVALLGWNFYTVQALQVTVAELGKTVYVLTETQGRETVALEKANEILTQIRIHLAEGNKAK